jgi:hypothetical protein
MIIIQSQTQKEVMAVDADDHLSRPFMFRFNFSEKQMTQMQVNCIPTRVTFFFTLHE